MKRRDVLIAKARRLSSERVRKFGVLPEDQNEWWRQITVVAHEAGITMAWDEWEELRLMVEQQRAKQDGMAV